GGGAVHPRNRPATEEQGGRERGERERGTELADEEKQEAQARVLHHVTGHELRFRDRHVERRLGELGLRGHHEQREAGELRENQGEADATPTEERTLLLENHDALQ